jgi:glutamine synthetase
MLAAGLEGIEKKYDCPEPVEENVYEISQQQRAQREIGTLPANLWEAINLTENSQLVRDALGEHAFHAFIESKKIEWNEYRTQVTQWELDKYLPVL